MISHTKLLHPSRERTFRTNLKCNKPYAWTRTHESPVTSSRSLPLAYIIEKTLKCVFRLEEIVLSDRAAFTLRNVERGLLFATVTPTFPLSLKVKLKYKHSLLNEQDLWILSDSRSSLQYLYNWITVEDKASVSILQKLRQISESRDIPFQWIPSHVNIFGNEQADLLAKEGCNASPPISSTLTFSEHQSRIKSEILKEWKIFALCTKTQQTSPDHILDCLGLSREGLFSSPLLVFDFLRPLPRVSTKYRVQVLEPLDTYLKEGHVKSVSAESHHAGIVEKLECNWGVVLIT
ncbi:RNase H domain-containing protein [Trichonephila clavipes]|nr:RNase H domain-containing protein [Trichonephila clavipes]